MGRTQREISSLFKSAPKSATALDEKHHERIVPVEELTAGMRLLVKPGDQFPVDAELVSGATAADESNLTGEAAPVDKRVGDTVFAGTIKKHSTSKRRHNDSPTSSAATTPTRSCRSPS